MGYTMSSNRTDYCEVQDTTSLGYLRITPIYAQQQHLNNKNTLMISPSITTAYVEPIGRKELARTWWENCPNQCMAHIPSNIPCTQYCKSLRKYVSILSKKMITTKPIITDGKAKRDSDDVSHIRNGTPNNCHRKLMLITHPLAAQKQQATLIHIAPIQQSDTRHNASIEASTYNIRIGNDWARPWMQFNVSIVQPQPKIALVSRSIKRSTTSKTTPVKRKLEFHPDNNLNDDTFSSIETKNQRYNDGNASLHDEMHLLQMNRTTERFRCQNRTLNPDYDQRLRENPQDMLCRSDESKTKNDIITIQQLISENAAISTPKDTSKRVPNVTPGTALRRDFSDKFNNESLSVQISSQRRLFSARKPADTFALNKHVERIFKGECAIDEQCLDNKLNFIGTIDEQSLSSQEEKNDGESDEDLYATYLSLPLPESYVPLFSHHDTESSVAQPISNSESVPLEDCAPRTKVVDLTYHDWKNMNAGQQPTELRMKTKSRFRQTMLELIILNNKEMESNVTNKMKMWLPSLFNEDTLLSPSWKFENFA